MKIVRWVIIVLLVVGLFLVRKFETNLFYDPLLSYFQGDYMNTEFPNVALTKHFMSITFRYFLNAVLSLGILYFLFKDIKIVKFASLLFVLFFFLFGLIYFYFIQTEFNQMFTAGFYVRRILIQPILLLVLIPAIWYYQAQKSHVISNIK